MGQLEIEMTHKNLEFLLTQQRNLVEAYTYADVSSESEWLFERIRFVDVQIEILIERLMGDE